MFMPGANPAMLRDAGLYGADSLMFDLEDAVSLAEKDTARALVHFALKTFDYGDTETIVRINDLNTVGKLDIDAVVRAGVDVIRLPKTECAQDVIDADEVITETVVDGMDLLPSAPAAARSAPRASSPPSRAPRAS